MASNFTKYQSNADQARRGIVVSNVPKDVTEKDVIIHFQNSRNGGGKINSIKYLNPDDSSVVIVTFEQPQTAETTINRDHIIGSVQVNVQRYPAPVFEQVQATVNTQIFTSSRTNLVKAMQDEFGVQYQYSNGRDEVYLTGSMEQIEQCNNYLNEKIYSQQVREVPSDTNSGGSIEKITEYKVFHTIPALLKFILTVPKYSQQLQDIEDKYQVKISVQNDGDNVKIECIPGCSHKQFEDGCGKFVDLYKKVSIKPMMLKELVLQPGPSSDHLTTDEAVHKIQGNATVVIGRAPGEDAWQFYGQEADVLSAIHDVCKMLCIDNPLKISSSEEDPSQIDTVE